MMKVFSSMLDASVTIGCSLAVFTFVGCGQRPEGGGSVNSAPPTTTEEDHPTEGPHHGGLIELGNEEYHAELVHDEASGTITVYLLDSAAENAVPVEATELLVNVSHNGKAEQFSLAANPDTGDPAGKASRFSSNDEELAQELDHEQVSAQLVVEIHGKQYRGDIQHDHDAHAH